MSSHATDLAVYAKSSSLHIVRTVMLDSLCDGKRLCLSLGWLAWEPQVPEGRVSRQHCQSGGYVWDSVRTLAETNSLQHVLGLGQVRGGDLKRYLLSHLEWWTVFLRTLCPYQTRSTEKTISHTDGPPTYGGNTCHRHRMVKMDIWMHTHSEIK